MSASSSTALAVGLERQREALALAPDRLEPVQRLDLRLRRAWPARRRLAGCRRAPCSARRSRRAARTRFGVFEIAGADQEEEVERRLLAGVEAVLGDVGDVEQLAHPAGGADAVEVLRRSTCRSNAEPPPSVS